ncbi:acyl carrier protein [Streptomyces sp. NPDC055239]
MSENVSHQSALAVVRQTLAQVLGIAPGRIEEDALLLGLPHADSLRLVETVVRLEDALGLKLDEESLIEVHTVDDLAQAVQAARS